MANKIINSSDKPFNEIMYSVDCFRKQKKATIVACYARRERSKHDKEKTECLSGWNCSLTEDPNNPLKPPCLDCPHQPKKYL